MNARKMMHHKRKKLVSIKAVCCGIGVLFYNYFHLAFRGVFIAGMHLSLNI